VGVICAAAEQARGCEIVGKDIRTTSRPRTCATITLVSGDWSMLGMAEERACSLLRNSLHAFFPSQGCEGA